MHGHPDETLGAWAAGPRLLPPHPTSSASVSLSHRRTELRIYARELRGWQGCDGPVCVCNGARVGGCEGGWAERLPWHSALGVGLPHSEGEEVGGTGRGFRERPHAWGPPARARSVHWRMRGTLGGWPLLQPLWATCSPLGFPSGTGPREALGVWPQWMGPFGF